MPDIEATGRSNARMRQTVSDMVRSMLVVLAIVVLLLLVTWRPKPEAVKVVDVTPAVTLAVLQASFPVQVPTGLPDGWRATSARWETTPKSSADPVFHIGYVTPDDAYAQVSESANSSAAYSAEQTDKGVPVGSIAIAGTSWETWEHADRRSLVRGSDGALIIVSGTSSWDELVALAAALQVRAAPTG